MSNEKPDLDKYTEEEVAEYFKRKKEKPYQEDLDALEKLATEVGKKYGKLARRVLADCAERLPKSR